LRSTTCRRERPLLHGVFKGDHFAQTDLRAA
jgi:hypothetical protein